MKYWIGEHGITGIPKIEHNPLHGITCWTHYLSIWAPAIWEEVVAVTAGSNDTVDTTALLPIGTTARTPATARCRRRPSPRWERQSAGFPPVLLHRGHLHEVRRRRIPHHQVFGRGYRLPQPAEILLAAGIFQRFSGQEYHIIYIYIFIYHLYIYLSINNYIYTHITLHFITSYHII